MDMDEESEHQARPKTPISLMMLERELLNCFSCFSPLESPIFQCKNGHAVCSRCNAQLANRCRFCPSAMGFKQYILVENIRKAARISCPNAEHGCEEVLSCHECCSHEKNCIYAPCCCPFFGCNFVAPFRQLYDHSSGYSIINFVLDEELSIPLGLNPLDEQLFCLREVEQPCLFVVTNTKLDSIGNLIRVSCVDPSRRDGDFVCQLSVETAHSRIHLESLMESSES